MVDKVKKESEKDKENDVEVIRKQMRDLTQHFNLYNKIVAEEIKINENLRYRKTLQIHKLQDNIQSMMKTAKLTIFKKNEGEVLSERDVDLYDLS
jgi:hypothetical protein